MVNKTDRKVRENCKKNKTWELFYPNGTSSLMNYDPIKKVEKDIIEKIEGLKKRKFHSATKLFGSNYIKGWKDSLKKLIKSVGEGK